jgi:hypothetical protein
VVRTLLDIYNDPEMETAEFIAIGNRMCVARVPRQLLTMR